MGGNAKISSPLINLKRSKRSRSNSSLLIGSTPDELDQFLTKPEVALQCVHELINALSVPLTYFDKILEPSSGEGAFVNAVSSFGIKEPRLIYIDVDAKDVGHRMDFLTSDLIPRQMSCLTIGNVHLAHQDP
jgi:hypothetical protein